MEKEQKRKPEKTRRKTRGKHAGLYNLSKTRKAIGIESAEPRQTDYEGEEGGGCRCPQGGVEPGG